jgi:hypothetical protein
MADNNRVGRPKGKRTGKPSMWVLSFNGLMGPKIYHVLLSNSARPEY